MYYLFLLLSDQKKHYNLKYMLIKDLYWLILTHVLFNCKSFICIYTLMFQRHSLCQIISRRLEIMDI